MAFLCKLNHFIYKNVRCKCSSVKDSIIQAKNRTTANLGPATIQNLRQSMLNGPNLKDFINTPNKPNLIEEVSNSSKIPYIDVSLLSGNKRKVYFDVYGCQMNVNDTEIIWSILKANDYVKTNNLYEAEVVLLVTCAIRESAEHKIWNRLKSLRGISNKRNKNQPKMKIGLLGCMAERLKTKVLEKEQCVDVVAGPDSYKDLPRLLALTESNQKAVNVLLSLDETYADVMPVKLNENSVTAYVSIMRGCDNMCTYCIVPFTRGRERSRPLTSILKEVEQLSQNGVKEITLLGQNVNSYRDISKSEEIYDFTSKSTSLAKGFKTVYKNKIGGVRFADLLEKVADVNPEMRIRFTSPHPKDFPDEVLQVIQSKNNICKNLHLPAQSGNSNVLERMRRGYTREAYLDLVQHIKKILPNVHLTSDFICGFCGETEEEFEDTLSLMDIVRYNYAYLFKYSMREKTTAHRRYKDDVLDEIKQKRLEKMTELFRIHALELNKAQIGQKQLILIEGVSKRSNNDVAGRNDGNIKVIIPNIKLNSTNGYEKTIEPGDYVLVEIYDANSQVLKGKPIYITNLIDYYYNKTQLSEK